MWGISVSGIGGFSEMYGCFIQNGGKEEVDWVILIEGTGNHSRGIGVRLRDVYHYNVYYPCLLWQIVSGLFQH